MAEAAGMTRTIRWLIVGVAFVAAAGTFLGARGCEQQRVKRELVDGERVPVVIAGKTFRLEPALDDATRTLGLGGRKSIKPDGGMLFVFPQPGRLEFVMRDCEADIDIAFLDDAGRVLALHAMKMEPPRGQDEAMMAYEMRLKRYPSRYPCRVVVEVAGGTFEKLGVKEGDRMDLDLSPLKARAR